MNRRVSIAVLWLAFAVPTQAADKTCQDWCRSMVQCMAKTMKAEDPRGKQLSKGEMETGIYKCASQCSGQGLPPSVLGCLAGLGCPAVLDEAKSLKTCEPKGAPAIARALELESRTGDLCTDHCRHNEACALASSTQPDFGKSMERLASCRAQCRSGNLDRPEILACLTGLPCADLGGQSGGLTEKARKTCTSGASASRSAGTPPVAKPPPDAARPPPSAAPPPASAAPPPASGGFPATVSLASRWRFDVLNSTGHWTGTIAFKRDGKTITGTWFTDQFGAEEPLTNITLTSGEVSFTRPRAGQDFRGVISNGTMTGTFTWSGRDWDWKATLLDSTDLHQVRGVTASASSVCAPDRFRYDPELAVDGDPKTAWFPRRTDRTNRGQWIRFELARAVPVEGMVLVNGWAESELNWRSNSRVKEADLTTSAGDRVRIQLRDSSLPQWFWLPGKSPVGWIQLTVVDSHHGDRASEAGITDVVLYGPEAPAPALVVVEGVVLDERSHAGVEAEVVAEDPATGEIQARGTSARESGGWQLRLPPGRPYVVSYRKSGYFFGSQRIEVPAGGAHHVIRQEGTMVPLREGASLALVDTFFVTGRSELTPEGGFGLAKVVELLRQNPALRLEVGGHTDNVGSAEANLGLSQDRATAVRDFLVARGIAGTRLKARGYGATQPRADNATAEGRALNRRTELRVLEGAP